MTDGKLSQMVLPMQADGLHCILLTGSVDVEAAGILDSLAELPADCRCVELNLVSVQRINSMGLAHLLKLFEQWQAQNRQIRVTNANRMISVLFKMTGLTHYLHNPTNPANPQPTLKTPVPTTEKPLANTDASVAISRKVLDPTPKASPPSLPSRKLKFWVSVQNSQQLHGWYFFNTYLQRQLGREIHMELIHGPIPETRLREVSMDMVFCKPFDAARMLLEQQFQPIVCPVDQSDEVTLLARVDDPRIELSAYQNGIAATATQEDFVYLLGRFLLEEDESALRDLDYQFLGCDIKTLQALIKGHADIVFLLSESYRSLSGLTKRKLRVLDQSDTQFAFHLFCLAPHCLELAESLETVLLGMQDNYQGRQILRDLGMTSWSKPARDEIDMLTQLYRRYT